jgi:NDP-sugar pyrophosphorylase family protein
MPIGDRAILEIVLGQLASFGFTSITLSVGYLEHLIRAVLNGGEGHGVEIDYVSEGEPIGTAGPLRLVEGLDKTFIAMNGDVLTTLDYHELLRCHRENGNVLTIATYTRTTKIDYGVLHLDGVTADSSRGVKAYEEKPELSMMVSMGIYALEPEVLGHIPAGQFFDFPDLVKALLDAGQPVGALPFDDFWLDIGRHEDYEQANQIWETTAHRFTYAQQP